MSQTFSIELPDSLQQTLIQQATQTQTTPEQIILIALNQYLQPTDRTPDPLFQLAGSITSHLPDLADNHDHYIGQTLHDEMQPNE